MENEIKKIEEFIKLLNKLENKFDSNAYSNLVNSIRKYILNNFKDNQAFIYLLNTISETGTIKEVKKVRRILEIILTSINNVNLSKYIIENLIPELTNLLIKGDLFIESKSINRNKFEIWESDIRDYLERYNFKPPYYENFIRISQNSNNPLQVEAVIYKRRILENIFNGLLEEGENLLKINKEGTFEKSDKNNLSLKKLTEKYEYDLHPKIIKVSMGLFMDGYYSQAIEEAFKRVIKEVKDIVNPIIDANLDGDQLMNRAFGCKNQEPVIKFNDLKSREEKDEQTGIMFLFKGIVFIRHRKAHDNVILKDTDRAFEYLALASLLIRLLGSSNINK
jgi:uncharacterized protein (TIGR02391 family)